MVLWGRASENTDILGDFQVWVSFFFPLETRSTSAYPERGYPEHWLSSLLERAVTHPSKHGHNSSHQAQLPPDPQQSQ